MTCPNLKAVIFDIGGVVLKSPFLAIAAYEQEHNLPDNYINVSITRRGDSGAWQKFERGEMPLYDFYKSFGDELSDTRNGNIWYTEYSRRKGMRCPALPEKLAIDGRELFGRMMRESSEYDELVVNAIRRIRESRRWRVIALTNNFSKFDSPQASGTSGSHVTPLSAATGLPATELAFLGWDKGGPVPPSLRSLFDDFCDSSTLGMRKPDPAFYLLACQRNEIAPEDAVFLDDIGANLKTARDLGMQTIRVSIGGSLSALKKLEVMLGIGLTDGAASISKL
ncbi:epoxide hydrolase [Heliocybe sulcata]|uniref:Epoxide hydrolase n=1 Tax=Heliocybe sulcata TaxID=5364 RepID=A0A5C3NE77_9AGAM|nr:epoxide hydrolase [Heliocybe sulcata]